MASSPLNTFEEIAEYLPTERRERWFRVLARYRQLNEDDDMLFLCEIIAASGLINRETPERIATVLKLLDSSLEKDRKVLLSSLSEDRMKNAVGFKAALTQLSEELRTDALTRRKEWKIATIAIVTAALVCAASVGVLAWWHAAEQKQKSQADASQEVSIRQLASSLADRGGGLAFAADANSEKLRIGPLPKVHFTQQADGDLLIEWGRSTVK